MYGEGLKMELKPLQFYRDLKKLHELRVHLDDVYFIYNLGFNDGFKEGEKKCRR
jgi:hypothetical protein